MPLLFTDTHSSAYLSTKEASEISGYNPDYLSRLCRSGAIKSKQLGRTWIIDRAALEAFVESQKERKEQLRTNIAEEREREYREHTLEQESAVNAIRKVEPVAYNRQLAALAVSLVVVAGTAYGSTSPLIVGSLNRAPQAAERLARTFGPQVVLPESDFRVAQSVTQQPTVALRLPAPQEAAASIARVSGDMGGAPSLASVAVLDSNRAAPAISYSVTGQARAAAVAHAFTHPRETIASLAYAGVRGYVGIGWNTIDAAHATNDAYLATIFGIGSDSLDAALVVRDTSVRAQRVPDAILAKYERGLESYAVAAPRAADTAVFGTLALGSVLADAGLATPDAIATGVRESAQDVSSVGIALLDRVAGTQVAIKPATEQDTDSFQAVVLGFMGNVASRIDGPDGGVPAETQVAGAAFAPGSWQYGIASMIGKAVDAVATAIGTGVRAVASVFGLPSFTTDLAILPFSDGEVLAPPSPADVSSPGFSAAILGDSIAQTIIQQYYPQTIVTGPTDQYILDLVRPYISRNIDSTSDRVRTKAERRDGTLENTTIEGGTATLESATIDSLVVGSTTVNQLTLGTAVITSATSTNLFSQEAVFTNATTTNSFISSLRATSGVIDALTSTLATITTAAITTLTATDATFTNATTTNATTTNAYTQNAVTDNATTTNAFITSLRATTGIIDTLTSTLATLTTAVVTTLTATDATFTNATTTNATTTNAYTQNAVTDNATTTNSFIASLRATTGVIDTLTSTLATLTDAIVTNLTVTNAVITNSTTTNATTTNAYIERLSVGTTSSTGLIVSGNAVLGGSSADSIIVNASFNSNLIPSTNATFDLGSPSFFWDDGYFDTITVNNISAASTSIGGTASETFTLNSDNATSDTEDISLLFYRGMVVPNALLTWNSTADRFEFNQPLYIENMSGSTTIPTLVAKGIVGQSADLLRALDSSDNPVLVANANGRVGIGTSSPLSTLFMDTTDALRLPTGTTAQRPTGYTGYVRYNTTTLQFEGYGADGVWQGLGGVVDTDQDTYISADTNNIDEDTLRFFTAGSERMTISSAGNVGIGTTTPNNLLTVAATGGGSGINVTNSSGVLMAQLIQNTAGNGGRLVLAESGTSNLVFTVNSDSGTSYMRNTRLHIGSNSAVSSRLGVSGNVAIGSTYSTLSAPTNGLLVEGNVGIGSSTPYAKLSVTGAGTTTGVNFQTTNSSNTPLFTILDSGNVGIGTSSPAKLLELTKSVSYGHIKLSGSQIAEAVFGHSNAFSTLREWSIITNEIAGGFQINQASSRTGEAKDGTARFVIDASGNVGIGTTTPDAKLTVVTSTSDTPGSNLALNLTDGADRSFGLRQTVVNRNLALDYKSGGVWATALTVLRNNGYVGIGTTSPSAQLAVTGSGTLLSASEGTGSVFTVTGQNAQNSTLVLNSPSISGNGMLTLTSVPGANSAYIASTGRLRLFAGGTERVTIDTAGNVGIGSTTPVALLSLKGTDTTSKSIILTDSSDVEKFSVTNAAILTLTRTNSLTLNPFNGSGGNDATIIGSSNIRLGSSVSSPALYIASGAFGNIGIGTTSPRGKLEIYGSAATEAYLNAGTSASLRVEAGGTAYSADLGLFQNQNGYRTYGNYLQTTATDSDLTFVSRTNNSDTTRLTIKNATGNVGIGTTTPSERLSVSSTGNTRLVIDTSNSGAQSILSFRNNNSTKFEIGSQPISGGQYFAIGRSLAAGDLVVSSDGNVGIGTTSPSTFKLQVLGNIGPDADSTYNLGSATRRFGSVYARFFDSGANTMSVAAPDVLYTINGTQRLNINQGLSLGSSYVGTTAPANGMIIEGNVGIGTSSPFSALSVSTNSSNAFIVKGTASSANPRITSENDAGIQSSFFTQRSGAGTATVFDRSDAGTVMIFDSSGRVGIGTSSSSYKLTVYDSSGSNYAAVFRGAGGNMTAIGGNANAAFVQGMTAAGANASLSLQQNGGNVGIGTTTPANLLTLQAVTPNIQLSTTNGAVGAQATISHDVLGLSRASIGFGSITGGQGFAAFSTGAGSLSEVMRIVSGKVGIGTTSPISPLSVTGSGTHGGVSDIALQSSASVTTSGHDWITGYDDLGNQRFAIYSGSSGSTNSALVITDNNFGAGGILLNTVGVQIRNNSNNGGVLQLGTNGAASITAGNTLTISAGTSAILLNPSTTGNVGIGTTSPTSKLSVAGFINTDEFSGYQQGGRLLAYASTTNGATILGFDAGGQNATTSATLSAMVAVGYQALNAQTTAFGNTAVGYRTLSSVTTAGRNSAFGVEALKNNSTGTNNTAVGGYALTANSTGYSNAAVGYRALAANQTGYRNVSIGENAMELSTTGYENIAIGWSAFGRATAPNGAVAIGRGTGFYNTSGSLSTFIGAYAGSGTGNYTSVGSVIVGYQAGENVGTGSDYNTLIGYQAGRTITTGARNIMIGNGAVAPSITGSDQLNIGNTLYGNLSTGTIGIGSTTPYAKLSIKGAGTTTGVNFQATNSSNSPVFSILDNGNFDATGYGIVRGGLNIGGISEPTNNRLRLDQTDGSGGASVFEFYNGSDFMYWFLEGGGTGGRGQIRTDSARAIVLQDASTSSGGVGVGEKDPGSKLSVRGGVSIGSATYSVLAAPTNGLLVEGNVGIGTTSPFAKLSVAGNISADGTITGSTITATTSISAPYFTATSATATSTFDGGLRIGSIASTFTETVSIQPNASVASLKLFDQGGRTLILTSCRNCYDSTSLTHPLVGVYDGGSLLLRATQSGSSNVMLQPGSGGNAIVSGGGLGVGSSTPYAKLSVKGAGTTTGVNFQTTNSSDSPLFTILDSGNVGIGTTTPGVKLDVNGGIRLANNNSLSWINGVTGGTVNVLTMGTDNQVTLTAGPSGSSQGALTLQGNNDTRLYANGGNLLLKSTANTYFTAASESTVHMFISTAGNVGIATTSPAQKLSVAGDIALTGDIYDAVTGEILDIQSNDFVVNGKHIQSGFGLGIRNNRGTVYGMDYRSAGSVAGLALNSNSIEALSIDTSGNIGIGSTTPTAKFGITGSGATTGRAFTVANSSNVDKFTVLDNGTVQVTNTVTNAGGDLTLNGQGNVDISSFGGVSFRVRNTGSAVLAGGLGITSTFTGSGGAVNVLNATPTFTGTQSALVYGLKFVPAVSSFTNSSTFYGAYVDVSAVNTGTVYSGIFTGGNVGIGTTTPATTLDVYGTARARFFSAYDTSPVIDIYDSDGSTDQRFFRQTISGNAFNLDARNDAGVQQRVLLTAVHTGSIGIGTTTPSARLAITSGGTGTGRAFTIADSSSVDKFTVLDSGNITMSGSQIQVSASTFTIASAFGGGTNGAVNINSANTAIGYNGTNWITGGTTLDTTLTTVTTDKNILLTPKGTGKIGIGTTTPWGLLSINPDGITGPSFAVGSSTATQLVVTNGGNVGIGTASPVAKLDVLGSAGIAGGIALRTGGIDWRMYGSSNGSVQNGGGATAGFHISANSAGTDFWIGGYGNAVSNAFQSPDSAVAATVVAIRGVSGQTGDLLQIRSTRSATNGDILTVNSSGKAGIGSTTPYAKLSVKGAGTTTGVNFQTTNSSDSPLFTILDSGKVGIGTSSPRTRLEVGGESNPIIYLNSNFTTPSTNAWRVAAIGTLDLSANAVAGENSSPEWAITMGAQSDALTVNRATTPGGTRSELFRITSAGNVGIGTTSPYAKLSVAGQVVSDYFTATSTTATSTFSGALAVGSNTLNALLNGNVGIGTAAPTQKLTIDSGSTSYGLGIRSSDSPGIQIFNSTASRTWGTYVTNSGLYSIRDITGTSDRLVISTAGNVGIGSTTPSQQLSVQGNGLFSGSISAAAINATSTITVSGLTNGTNGLVLQGTTTAHSLSISSVDSAGSTYFNVTPGTANTQPLFFLNKSSASSIAQLAVRNNGGSFNYMSLGHNDTYGSLTTTNSTPIILQPTAGSVGIGTTSPAQTLSVTGNGYITGTLGIGVSTPTGSAFQVGDISNASLRITSTGVISHYYQNESNPRWILGRDTITSGGYLGFTMTGGSLATLGSAISIPENNAIALYTSNGSALTERLRVDSSGDVGIGTTTPSAKLTITPYGSNIGTPTNSGASLLVGQTTLLGTTAGSYLYPAEVVGNATNITRLQTALYRRVSGSAWQGTAYRIQYAVDNSFTDGSKAYVEIGSGDSASSGGGYLALGTAGSDRLVIDSSGNVGIGTTTPDSKLAIVGADPILLVKDTDVGAATANARLRLAESTTGGITENYWDVIGGIGGSFDFGISSNAYSNALTILRTSGNVGIGTTSPYTTLGVSGNVAIATSMPSLTFQDVGNSNRTSTLGMTDGFNMRLITGGGNLGIFSNTSLATASVGIGTTTSSASLAVKGNGTTAGNYQILTTNSSDVPIFAVQNDGNVGIGTTTPFGKLSITGPSSGNSLVIANSSNSPKVLVTTAGLVHITDNYSTGFTPTSLLTVTSGSHNTLVLSTVGRACISCGSDLGGIFNVESNGTVSRPVGIFEGASGQTGSFIQVRSNAATVGDIFTIESNGFVGIGTSTPQASLDIRKSYSAGTDAFRISFSDPTQYYLGIQPYVVGSGNVGYKFRTNNNTTAVDALSITGTGNVGIGTTTPSSLLHLYGSGTKDLIVESTTASETQLTLKNSARSWRIFNTGAGDMIFYDNNGGGGRLTLYNSTNGGYNVFNAGNVGVGSTTPYAKLSVKGSGTTTGVNFQTTNSSDSPLFTILDSGNIGVGTTTPSGNLVINGTTGQKLFQIATSTNQAVLTVTADGRLGIGTAAPDYKLAVTGSDAQINTVRVGQGANPNATASNANIVLGSGSAGGSLTTSAYRNYLFGYNAGANIATGGDNVIIGNSPGGAALFNSVVIGTNASAGTASAGSVVIGNLAGQNSTAGSQVLIGYSAGRLASGGSGSIGIGYQALHVATGATNLAIGYSAGSAITSGAKNVIIGANTGSSIATLSNNIILSDGDGNIRLFADSSGNVGIGTSTPGSGSTISSGTPKFHVVGSGGTYGIVQDTTSYAGIASIGATEGNLSLIDTGAASGSRVWNLNSNDGSLSFRTLSDNSSSLTSTRLIITSTGAVGVGTTTPGGALSIHGAGNELQLSRTGINNMYGLFISGSGATSSVNLGEWGTGAGLSVNQAGSVGIGTTEPSAKLQVVGDILLGEGGVDPDNRGYNILQSYMSLGETEGGASTILGNNVKVANGVGSTLEVHSSGADGSGWLKVNYSTGFSYNRIGANTIGTQITDTTGELFNISTAGSVRFNAYGAGTLTTDASGNITASSDERLKDVNGDFTRGLDAIAQLSPILYNWNASSGLDQSVQYAGFSAQNVQGAIPEAVDTDPRGFLTLQDRPILAASINAIKELAGRTDTLSIATSTLAARITDIETSWMTSQEAAALPQALTATQVTAESLEITESITTNGTVSAARFVVPSEAQTFTLGSDTITVTAPSEALVAGSVDLYTLATYALANVEQLATRTELLAVKIEDLSARVTALESGMASTTLETIDGAAGLSASTLKNLLRMLGMTLSNGIASVKALVTEQLVFTADENGTSSAGSIVINSGETEVEVENAMVLPTSKIFITFTGSVQGSWYLTEKQTGSFKVKFSQPQPSTTGFDYFIVQTEGQIASAAASAPEPTAPTSSEPAPTAPAPVSQEGGPTVTLIGEAAIQIAQGAAWTDPGATAAAADGTSLTVAVSGSVDANTPGIYNLTYRATDSQGLIGEVSRIVSVLAPSVDGGGEAPAEEPSTVTEEPASEPTAIAEPAPEPAPEPTPEPEPAPAPAPEAAAAPAPAPSPAT